MQQALGLQPAASRQPCRLAAGWQPQPGRGVPVVTRQPHAAAHCRRGTRTLVSHASAQSLAVLLPLAFWQPHWRPGAIRCAVGRLASQREWLPPAPQGAAGGDRQAATVLEEQDAGQQPEQRQQQDGVQPPADDAGAWSFGPEEAAGQGEPRLPPKLRRYRPTPGALTRRQQQSLPPVAYDPAGDDAGALHLLCCAALS